MCHHPLLTLLAPYDEETFDAPQTSLGVVLVLNQERTALPFLTQHIHVPIELSFRRGDLVIWGLDLVLWGLDLVL